jgi:SagB-type dehydrogenase family enzyme
LVQGLILSLSKDQTNRETVPKETRWGGTSVAAKTRPRQWFDKLTIPSKVEGDPLCSIGKMKKVLLLIALRCLIVGGYLALGGYLEGEIMAENKEIQLPQPKTKGKVSLEEAIAKRRSVRNFAKKDLSLEEISQLLWAGQGITSRKSGAGLRAAPSAGAVYPMELYLLSPYGLFHYIPEGHKLEVLGSQDLRSDLSDASLDQSSVKEASVVIVICAVAEKITVKYGERGISYMNMEAGHIAQNIHLEAVALGLASVPVGAFSDIEVDKILDLPTGCRALYIIPVGEVK